MDCQEGMYLPWGKSGWPTENPAASFAHANCIRMLQSWTGQ